MPLPMQNGVAVLSAEPFLPPPEAPAEASAAPNSSAAAQRSVTPSAAVSGLGAERPQTARDGLGGSYPQLRFRRGLPGECDASECSLLVGRAGLLRCFATATRRGVQAYAPPPCKAAKGIVFTLRLLSSPSATTFIVWATTGSWWTPPCGCPTRRTTTRVCGSAVARPCST